MGTLAAQDALLASLDGRHWPVVVAPCFDPERFLYLVRQHRPLSCGLSGVMARMLSRVANLEAPAAQVRTLTIFTKRLPDVVAADLSRLFPNAQIDLRHDEHEPGVNRGSRSGPISGAQAGMVWHEQFSPGSFNLAPMARRYRGTLDHDALQGALNGVVNRHGALRTTFALDGAKASQVVSPPGHCEVSYHDLSHLDHTERSAGIARILADARSRPFDLTTDRLFQPILVKLAEDDHVLAVRAHHSVFDDWSVGVFRRELSVLYNALSQGELSPLNDEPAQLVDFASAQGQAMGGPAGQAELNFWKGELLG
ncbi:MAG: condensation domain-containing protein, partial [Pseudonocardiaceae bacterium]